MFSHFDQVRIGSPAQGELLRGDIITKIEEYDARDIRHYDAQQLFKSAGNSIKLVVHRDNKLNVLKNVANNDFQSSLTAPNVNSNPNLLSPNHHPHHHQQLPQRYVNFVYTFLSITGQI